MMDERKLMRLAGMPWKVAQQRVRSMFLAVQLRGWLVCAL